MIREAIEKISNKLEDLNPDIVVITGDLVDANRRLEKEILKVLK